MLTRCCTVLFRNVFLDIKYPGLNVTQSNVIPLIQVEWLLIRLDTPGNFALDETAHYNLSTFLSVKGATKFHRLRSKAYFNTKVRMFNMRVITGPLDGGGAVYHVILPSWVIIAFLLMTL